MANKKLIHPDIGIKEYGLVQDIVNTGSYVKSKTAYVKKVGKYYYLVAVKLANSTELIMNSFYKIEESNFKKIIKNVDK